MAGETWPSGVSVSPARPAAARVSLKPHGNSQSQTFEPVFAARPEPATLRLRLSAPRRAGGERLAASRASRMGERLGGGFRWRGVGDRVGARRRWKRPFDFPILDLALEDLKHIRTRLEFWATVGEAEACGTSPVGQLVRTYAL